MSSFTLDQKKAHDPHRHISITANAGSGKTRVLVSRYCDLVEHFNARPDRIAAITFTEKAAGELRGKIAAELERRLSDESRKAAWPKLKDAREKFTSALVTTIHGFCARLLREFPFEANVSPSFSVLSGFERARAEELALSEIIENVFDKDKVGQESYDRTYDTFRRVGRERAENILRMMLSKREAVTLARPAGALSWSQPQAIANWNTAINQAVRAQLLNRDVLQAAESLIGLLKDDKKPDALDALARAKKSDIITDVITAFTDLQKSLLTKSRTPALRNYSLPKDELLALTEHPVSVLNDALASAGDFLTGDFALHPQLYQDTHVLLGVYDQVVERYRQRKDRINALDFEDLQIRMLETLNTPAGQERVRDRFSYLMIDEFQDTNRLQYAIANKLLEGLQRGNLCVVGDVKQSIYGFRNAEVDVFASANKDIQGHNLLHHSPHNPLAFRTELIGADHEHEGLGIIRLSASFRLLPGICAYVNAACAPVMTASEANPFGVEYEPLVCARRSPGQGSVEFILGRLPGKSEGDEGGDEEAPENDSTVIPEEELLARRILQLLYGDQQPVWVQSDDGAETPRRATPGDIAVLCRRRAQFAPIQAVLRSYGIPFVTHGSTGFYSTQEVYDTASYLRTLLNSRDDLALLGTLRSPFYGVSDAELYRVSQTPPGATDTLWDRAVKHAETAEAPPELKRALDMIADDRRMASRIPVSTLIRRMVERTGWRGAVIGTERGPQAIANMEKVLDMARDFEKHGFTNLFDFVDQISAQIDEEEVEGEAPVAAGRDAVLLMTMHAAKGLEYPVVFLPSLHLPVRKSNQPFFDRDLGFGWSWRMNQTDYTPMVLPLMSLRQRLREQAEEARLFYVAATRARDLLVIGGQTDGQKLKKDTMLDWALRPFGHIPLGNVTVDLRSPDLRFLLEDGATESLRQWNQQIPFHATIDLPHDMPDQQPQARPFRADAVAIGELPARAEGDVYSASQFFVYTQCPTKYYLKYRLGIPEDFADAYGADADDLDAGEDGTAFARTFRLAAQRIDAMNEPGSDIAGIINDALLTEPMPVEQAQALRQRLSACFARILDSAPARAVLFPHSQDEHFVQHELRVPFAKEYIVGVMDRMTRAAADGTLSVLHYKTMRLPAGQVQSVAEGYLPQLRFYAYLTGMLNPEQRTVQATLLFTEHPDTPVTFTFNTFELRRMERDIDEAIQDIRSISYTGRGRLPLATPHCPHCPYYAKDRCMLGRE